MAERLEGATKIYEVPLLISGDLWRHFTRATKSLCRQVDYCTMAGNSKPVKLFTIDVDPEQVPLEEETLFKTLKQMKIERVHQRIKRNNMREAAFKSDIQISDGFKNITEVVLMRKPFGEEWMKTYNTAFSNYLKGHWKEALIYFNKILKMKKDDGPTIRLMNFMKITNNVPPPGWKGYKHLDE